MSSSLSGGFIAFGGNNDERPVLTRGTPDKNPMWYGGDPTQVEAQMHRPSLERQSGDVTCVAQQNYKGPDSSFGASNKVERLDGFYGQVAPGNEKARSEADQKKKKAVLGVIVVVAFIAILLVVFLAIIPAISDDKQDPEDPPMGKDTADLGEVDVSKEKSAAPEAPGLPTVAGAAADANSAQNAMTVVKTTQDIIKASEDRDRAAADAKKLADAAVATALSAERAKNSDAAAKRAIADKAVAIAAQRAAEAKEAAHAKKLALAEAMLAAANSAKSSAADAPNAFKKKLYSKEAEQLTAASPRAVAWAHANVTPGLTKEVTLSDSMHYKVHKASNNAVRVLEKRKATKAEIKTVYAKGLTDANYPNYEQLWVNHNDWQLGYWSKAKERGRSRAMDDFHGGRPYRVWDLEYDGVKKHGGYFFNYKLFSPGSDGSAYTMQNGSFVVLWPIKVSQRTYVVPYTCSMVAPLEERKKGFGWVSNQGQWLPAGFDGIVKFRFHVRPGEKFSLKYCNNVSLQLTPENTKKAGTARISTPLVARSYLSAAPSYNEKFARKKDRGDIPK